MALEAVEQLSLKLNKLRDDSFFLVRCNLRGLL